MPLRETGGPYGYLGVRADPITIYQAFGNSKIPRPQARGSAPRPYGGHPTRYPRDDDDDDDDDDHDAGDDDEAAVSSVGVLAVLCCVLSCSIAIDKPK